MQVHLQVKKANLIKDLPTINNWLKLLILNSRICLFALNKA